MGWSSAFCRFWSKCGRGKICNNKKTLKKMPKLTIGSTFFSADIFKSAPILNAAERTSKCKELFYRHMKDENHPSSRSMAAAATTCNSTWWLPTFRTHTSDPIVTYWACHRDTKKPSRKCLFFFWVALHSIIERPQWCFHMHARNYFLFKLSFVMCFCIK